jgi:hypothetical protein
MNKFIGYTYIIALILAVIGVAILANNNKEPTIRVQIPEPHCIEWITLEGITGCYRWSNE